MIKSLTKGLLFVAAALSIGLGSAEAGIISVAGQLTQVFTPPASVKAGAYQSDAGARVFLESTGKLSQSISVDTQTTGLYDRPAQLTGGSLAKGTEYQSYFINSDPINPPKIFVGSVTFNTNIIGVEVLSASLSATDSITGNPGTYYNPLDKNRGLELNPSADFFSISSNMRTLTFNLHTYTDVDQIRILTATPEPGTLALGAIGGLVLAAYGVARRRSGKA